MNSRLRVRACSVLGLLGAVVLATACSGSQTLAVRGTSSDSHSASPSTSAHPANASPDSAVATPAPLSTAHSSRPTCSYLTPTQVATAFGVSQVRWRQGDDGGCEFDLTGSDIDADIRVVVSYNSLQGMAGFKAGQGAHDQTVPGVGDRALYTAPSAAVADPGAITFIRKGTVLDIVAGGESGDPLSSTKAAMLKADLIKLAQDVSSNIH